MPSLKDYMADRELLDPGTYTLQIVEFDTFFPENETTQKGNKAYPSLVVKFKDENGKAHSDFMNAHPKSLWKIAEMLSAFGVSGDDEIPDLNDVQAVADFGSNYVGIFVKTVVKKETYNDNERNTFRVKGLAEGGV